MRDAMLNTNRGVYDFLYAEYKQGRIWLFEMPGNQQLSPLQVGEDNTELWPKELRKSKFLNVVKQNVDRVSLGMSSQNLYTVAWVPGVFFVLTRQADFP